MQRVGLDYLTLDRPATTLSGGEAQRIRLAAQLGSNLRGVLYVLDEPTIGLHERDNRNLLDALEELVKQGNSLLVVEHDEETMRRATRIIDLGPAPVGAAARSLRPGPSTKSAPRKTPSPDDSWPIRPNVRRAAAAVPSRKKTCTGSN